jgi:sortase A
MRRGMRTLGTLLAAAGVLTLVWAFLVWQWQDPFTLLYTKWKQRELVSQYEKQARSFKLSLPEKSLAAERAAMARAARRYRLSARRGQAIGRIRVPRMGVNMIMVNGTDPDSLKKGPGRDTRTFMPGENRLVYVAGHRTTYSAPFSSINSMRKGDRVTIEVPYGRFIYSMTHHRIVASTDLSVLRSPRYEVLELQACHPRFFASHRYIAYARLTRVEPRGGTPYDAPRIAAQSSDK